MILRSLVYYIIIAGGILFFLAIFSFYVVSILYLIGYFIKENYSLPAVERFKKKSGAWLKTKGTLWLKGIHLFCDACWLGAAFSMVVVSCFSVRKGDWGRATATY